MSKQQAVKRVGLLIGTLEVGGAERMALAVARGLLDQGFDVRFYCLDPEGDMPMPGTPEQQQELLDRLHIINQALATSTFYKVLALPLSWLRLRKRVKADGVELMISFMERANILNLLGGYRIPKIISIRKHLGMALKDKDPLKRSLVFWGYRLLLTRANVINLNSHEAADDLQQRFPAVADTSVIHNFYDEQMLQRARQSLPEESLRRLEGTVIMTCGRLVKVKRQDALLRAFSLLAGRFPEARLVIVGEGAERTELTALAERLGLTQRVVFAGFQANPYAWIQHADVFVLSSKAEGFPNALLEAMALARPVVSSDCRSGPRELLAPDTAPLEKTQTMDQAAYGLLTAPMEERPHYGTQVSPQEQHLADAIGLLLSDSKQRQQYAEKAQQRAQQFSRQNIIDQWVSLVSDHLKRG